jgi:small subunit ribosomal protein S4
MLSALKKAARQELRLPGPIKGKNPKFSWIDWNETQLQGTFITYPERESVPENIKEQLIVELYSK